MATFQRNSKDEPIVVTSGLEMKVIQIILSCFFLFFVVFASCFVFNFAVCGGVSFYRSGYRDNNGSQDLKHKKY